MGETKKLLGRLLDEKKLSYCQDCGSCTGSCPMAKVLPDKYNPRKLLQRVTQDLPKLLESDELWLCAWCYKCTERCPSGIQPTEIFLLTRNLASKEGHIPRNPKAIMRQIMKSGRSVQVPDDFDDWRGEYGLPPIGVTISQSALDEQRKIFGKANLRRLES
jgi:heterodisulfide reductase subunit C2